MSLGGMAVIAFTLGSAGARASEPEVADAAASDGFLGSIGPLNGADWQEPRATPFVFGTDRSATEDGGTTSPYDSKRRLRWGPVVGTGFPNLLAIGATLKFGRFFGAGVNWGMIPEVPAPGLESTSLAYKEYDVYARVYPFGDALFASLGVGYEEVSAATAQDFQFRSAGGTSAVSLSGQASFKALLLIPQIGVFHTFDSGFSIGSDVGVQIPVSSSAVTLTENPAPTAAQRAALPALGEAEEKVVNTLSTYSKTPIPSLTFRLGWLL